MVKVYPVTKVNIECEDYAVYVNGEKVELNTARVSAYAFNRRWPGHQRQIDQTELINFLSMQADEPFTLKVVPKTPSLSVQIRPRNLCAQTTIDANGTITVRVEKPMQFTIEPYGRNRALHVFVDPIKDYRIDKDSDDVLYFGKGEHDVGDIYLKSGQTLFIDEGAVVYASVFGVHADNVKILGRGILDNSKNKETILYEANVENNVTAVNNAKRMHAVNFVCCKNVEIDGITIRDSLVYNINSLSCDNVNINNIKIIGCWRFNSDGVHFSNCQNSSLTNSFLRTYDDSICVRGYAVYDYRRSLDYEKQEDLSFVCKNILIKNCVVWNDWGKNLQIGTETYSDEISNVIFEDCKLIHNTGAVITMLIVDNPLVKDIFYKNIQVEYDNVLLKRSIQQNDDDVYIDKYDPDYGGDLVLLIVRKHFEYSIIKTEEELGRIDGVTFDGLNLYSIQKPAFLMQGNSEKSSVNNVVFKNFYWNGEKITQETFEKNLNKNQFVNNVVLE